MPSMANVFSLLQAKLAGKDVPEYVSSIPAESMDADVLDELNETTDITMAEIAKNNDLLPFLTDNFGFGRRVDLQKVALLLKGYRPVEGEFFSDEPKQMHEELHGSQSSEFKTASGKYIKLQSDNGSKAAKVQAKMPSDAKAHNVPDDILEKIRNEIVERNCKLSWDDIVGLELVKKTINEIVLWPMMRPDIFTGLRGPPKGLLLFGPPGTGKTMIGKCIASQCNATFFSISASSLTSKYVGEGEKMVRGLFHVAREMSPSVIFIDEIDSLLSQRSDNENEGSRRIKTEFLVQFDGAKVDDKDNILVIGATNRPHEIDEAARRRLVKRIYVPLPESNARQAMVSHLLKSYKNSVGDSELASISELTSGYSGSDIFNLCREATLEPLREIDDISLFNPEDVRSITLQDFRRAAQQIRKSVSKDDLRLYDTWNKDYGSMQAEIN